jgi:hypothetical protein
VSGDGGCLGGRRRGPLGREVAISSGTSKRGCGVAAGTLGPSALWVPGGTDGGRSRVPPCPSAPGVFTPEYLAPSLGVPRLSFVDAMTGLPVGSVRCDGEQRRWGPLRSWSRRRAESACDPSHRSSAPPTPPALVCTSAATARSCGGSAGVATASTWLAIDRSTDGGAAWHAESSAGATFAPAAAMGFPRTAGGWQPSELATVSTNRAVLVDMFGSRTVGAAGVDVTTDGGASWQLTFPLPELLGAEAFSGAKPPTPPSTSSLPTSAGSPSTAALEAPMASSSRQPTAERPGAWFPTTAAATGSDEDVDAADSGEFSRPIRRRIQPVAATSSLNRSAGVPTHLWVLILGGIVAATAIAEQIPVVTQDDDKARAEISRGARRETISRGARRETGTTAPWSAQRPRCH